MASTYTGYAGEFSSDEDVDKMEQQQSTQYGSYNHAVKPTKSQIDQAIEAIRSLPIEEDVRISDELLAGLLDHFKTQRGPIVDSTRNLYKKIIIRLVRGEQQQTSVAATNGDINNSLANTNGNGNVNMQVTNDIINNNNDIILMNKKPIIEIPSSDEDEPMPASQEQAIKKFDSRVVYSNNNNVDDDDKLVQPMEVDNDVQPSVAIRASKTVEMATTDEDNSETEESSEEEVLDITPAKIEINTQKTSTPIVNFKKTAKRADLAAMRKATSSATTELTATESTENVKKPYTRRSQRVAATRASTSPANKSSTSISSSGSKVASSADVSSVGMKTRSKSALSSKFNTKYFISLVIVVVLAFFVYYFKSDIMSSTQRLMNKVDIKF